MPSVSDQSPTMQRDPDMIVTAPEAVPRSEPEDDAASDAEAMVFAVRKPDRRKTAR